MDIYRITTRFDLNNEAEKHAADYLRGLQHGKGNRFVIDAVLAQINGSSSTMLLEQIRQVVREEIHAMPVAAVPAPVDQCVEQQDDASILDDLKLFG